MRFTYDGDGHRTQIRKFVSGNGTATETWDFRYQGDAIVEEKLTDSTHAGVVVRSYVVDEAGAVVKMTRSFGGGDPHDGTYLVTWNGHGDAIGLWRIETTGALTLANSYTYTTWGAPTTTTHNGIADLGFRFLYVGQHDVQWDNTHGLGLHYMHARHYSPALGRFLQPDPVAAEENAWAYAANSPVTRTDPQGTAWVVAIPIGWCLINFWPCMTLVSGGAIVVSQAIGRALSGPTRLPCLWNCTTTIQRAKVGITYVSALAQLRWVWLGVLYAGKDRKLSPG